MLPAVSDRRDLDGEPASKRGVAGVRTHERYKKKKSLINSSRQSSNRNHTAVDLESWSGFLQCFTFSRCGWFVPSGEGSSSVFRGVTGFYFFFLNVAEAHLHLEIVTCVRTAESTPSQTREHWKQHSLKVNPDGIVPRDAAEVNSSYRSVFRADLNTAKGARHWRSLRLSVKRNLTFRIRHRHPERWVSVCILLS